MEFKRFSRDELMEMPQEELVNALMTQGTILMGMVGAMKLQLDEEDRIKIYAIAGDHVQKTIDGKETLVN